jgi:hypothetical protein
MADVLPYPDPPRWVKLTGLITAGATLLVAFVAVAGGHHGPGHSMPTGHSGSPGIWGLLALVGVLAAGSLALNWSWLAALGITPTPGRDRHRGPRWPWPLPLLTPGSRRLALTAHVAFSVGSLGAVATFLLLAIAGLTGSDAPLARAAYLAMDATARLVIAPLIAAALVSGLISSLGTPWGLVRHYWVVVKLLLTAITLIVLLQQLEPIRYLADAAAEAGLSAADLRGPRWSLAAHAGGGLLVLLLATVLGTYKPKGMTRYGWRRQQE